MTGKELQECRWRRGKIRTLRERVERIDEQIKSAGARPADRERAGGCLDAVGEAVARMQELRGELLREALALEEQLQAVERWLDTLPPNRAAVLRLRYVDGYSWRRVAREACYTVEHCRKINSEEIRKLDTH